MLGGADGASRNFNSVVRDVYRRSAAESIDVSLMTEGALILGKLQDAYILSSFLHAYDDEYVRIP